MEKWKILSDWNIWSDFEALKKLSLHVLWCNKHGWSHASLYNVDIIFAVFSTVVKANSMEWRKVSI